MKSYSENNIVAFVAFMAQTDLGKCHLCHLCQPLLLYLRNE
jgi:hypothetical protein